MYEAHSDLDASRQYGAESFVNFFVQYCLHHFFKSKREMSRELDIGYRSILLVTNKPGRYKGATLVFQELIVYCIRRGISLDQIAEAYLRENSSSAGNQNHLRQDSLSHKHCPLFIEYCCLPMQNRELLLLEKAQLFLSNMCMILCEGCMRFWSDSTHKECLIQQTKAFIMMKLYE